MTIEGLFRRPPEDEAIPVLTEVIVPPAAEPAPTNDLMPVSYRGDPMSADFAADVLLPQIPPSPPAPEPVAEATLPPAAPPPAPAEPAAAARLPQITPAESSAPNSQFDIPPLVIHLPETVDDAAYAAPVGTATIPTLDARLDAGMPPGASPVTQTQRLALLPEVDLSQFEDELRDAVIRRLHPRIDAMLEHKLIETLKDVLEAELPALQLKLRVAVTETVNDVVARAVAREIAKINSARASQR